MSAEKDVSNLKWLLGGQVVVFLLLGLSYSLPCCSDWLQDKLNLVSTNLMGSTSPFVANSLFQAGAFVLVLVLLVLAFRGFMDPQQAGSQIKTLIGLNLAYGLAALVFFLFSSTKMFHDLFAFIVFGGLGVWTLLWWRKLPAKTS